MNQAILDYIAFVRHGPVLQCNWQILLCDLVEKAFLEEDIHVDEDQFRRYMGLQRYIPFRLMLWEEFLFCLHNCVYDKSGQLRWPELVALMGRGSGKNGYLSFEDFALLTPVNGIPEYDIDIFAMSETQARTSFDEIHGWLESNPKLFKPKFAWTKEKITNRKTKSTLRFRAANAKTADGMKPGKVDNDEVHAYADSRLMDTGKTGLGKKPHPRQTKISTLGNVRDGPLDHMIELGQSVLKSEQPDNGVLYAFWMLDSAEEIDREECWYKANPSLHDPNRPQLLAQIRREYVAYKQDPVSNSDFATKRMNILLGNSETAVASWEDIKAACGALPEESRMVMRPAVCAVDYASTQDFVAAGVLMKIDGDWCFEHHTWICLQSKGLHRIKFPYQDAAARGECTLVDAPEIDPELPLNWIEEKRQNRNLLLYGIDHFRYTLFSKRFGEHGILPVRSGGNLKLTYTPEQSQVAPIIASAFINHKIRWGDSMMMRWYTNNACRMNDKKGNITFGKIEPKARKTDGFMAFVMCMVCAHQEGIELEPAASVSLPDLYTY